MRDLTRIFLPQLWALIKPYWFIALIAAATSCKSAIHWTAKMWFPALRCLSQNYLQN